MRHVAFTDGVTFVARTEFVCQWRHIGTRDGAEHNRRVLACVHAVLRIQRVQHPLQGIKCPVKVKAFCFLSSSAWGEEQSGGCNSDQ